MRVRILGQYVPASLAVLACIEALLCFLALYVAVCIRFQVGPSGLPELLTEFGPLWPRGVAFSAIVVTCLLAFGLYNSRQRTQLSGILARLLLALLVAAFATAVLFYVTPPSQHMFRGVAALAVILAIAGVLTSRLIFARVADEDIFKRRVLVYGAGYAAAALTRLRRSRRRARSALSRASVCSSRMVIWAPCASSSVSLRSWWLWMTGGAVFRSPSCSIAGWRVSMLPSCSPF